VFDSGLVPYTGPTLVPPALRKVRAGTYNACSDRVRRQGLEPRTRGLRVRFRFSGCVYARLSSQLAESV